MPILLSPSLPVNEVDMANRLLSGVHGVWTRPLPVKSTLEVGDTPIDEAARALGVAFASGEVIDHAFLRACVQLVLHVYDRTRVRDAEGA